MFLDEQLYQIGIKVSNGYDDAKVIKDIIMLCLDTAGVDLKQLADDKYLIPVFKRINISWNIAIERLNKQGYNITIKDGFLLFLLHSDTFKYLHPTVNTILKSIT